MIDFLACGGQVGRARALMCCRLNGYRTIMTIWVLGACALGRHLEARRLRRRRTLPHKRLKPVELSSSSCSHHVLLPRRCASFGAVRLLARSCVIVDVCHMLCRPADARTRRRGACETAVTHTHRKRDGYVGLSSLERRDRVRLLSGALDHEVK